MFGTSLPFGQQLTNPASSVQFGLNSTQSQPNSSTGYSGFSQPLSAANVATSGIFGSAPTSTSLFGTGLAAPKQTTNLFTSPFTTSSVSTFPTSGLLPSQQGTGFNFGSAPTQSSLLLTQPRPSTTLSTAPTTTSLLQARDTLDVFFASLSQPLLLGDERDAVLARWNQLQAMWGFGIGFSALGIATYTRHNTFSRFKAIAYNVIPTSAEADGLVSLQVAHPFTTVLSQKQGIQDSLFRILGSRPNLQIVVEEIRPCTTVENNSELIIKVVERQQTGSTTNVSAHELAKYLTIPAVVQQLQSQLNVLRLTPEVSPSPSQITSYYETPPTGIDRLIWQQARIDNPCPDRLIPVPLVGFDDLRRRKQDQIGFSDQQSAALKQLRSVVGEMKIAQLSLAQKVTQLKRQHIELSHRVFKVLRRQEMHRRAGYAISAEEEALRCGLERLWSELLSPRGLRSRVQDAMAVLRIGPHDVTGKSQEMNGTVSEGDGHSTTTVIATSDAQIASWALDSDAMAELKEYLVQRHSGLREMKQLLTELTGTLKVMESNPLPASIATAPYSPVNFGAITPRPGFVSTAIAR